MKVCNRGYERDDSETRRKVCIRENITKYCKENKEKLLLNQKINYAINTQKGVI